MTSLINKYRPATFSDVLGQAGIVRALQEAVKRRDVQQFLFHGSSGVGKTTLARITAREMGIDETGLVEIDAARWNGVDDMRAIQDTLQYRSFGKSGGKAVILDECHRLSRQAWDTLLKAIEEPAAHVLFFFCTTELGKVPATVKTRCTSFAFKPIDDKLIGTLYDDVCEQEKINLSGDIGDLIIAKANGSPRQLLTNITAARSAKTKREAAELLEAAVETDAIIDLCRYLAKGGGWRGAMAIVKKLEAESAETVRIVVSQYFASALMGADNDRAVTHFLNILDNFSQTYNPSEKQAPLLISIGRTLFAPG